jgi:phosphomannomutase
MIMFEFENKVCITLRASGTEPKLKVYSEVVSEAGSEGGEGSVQEALQRFVEACIEEMLQPEANALVRA